MKQRALIGLLALSVLFNIFVLLGFARARRAAETAISEEKVVQQVAAELKLDPAQAQRFGELRSSMRRDTAKLNESLSIIRQRMMTELRAESPSIETVRQLVDEETEMLRQRRMLGAETFERFIKELTPQQRQAMNRRVARNPRGIPPHIVKRFDADKNGTLDQAELDAAMAQPDFGRQNRSPRRPPPMTWQRFDADQNGMLDAQELAKMDEFWRERPRQSPDRPDRLDR